MLQCHKIGGDLVLYYKRYDIKMKLEFVIKFISTVEFKLFYIILKSFRKSGYNSYRGYTQIGYQDRH